MNDEIANRIVEMGFGKSTIMADSAEQKSIDEIKKLGIYRIKPCVKGQGSILQGIQKLQQFELVIHPDCKEIINELQNYAWEKDKQTNEEYMIDVINIVKKFIDLIEEKNFYTVESFKKLCEFKSNHKDKIISLIEIKSMNYTSNEQNIDDCIKLNKKNIICASASKDKTLRIVETEIENKVS